MMVNSHLKTQQTKAIAGLEGLQAASPSTAGPSPGTAQHRGDPPREGWGEAAELGRLARRGWGFSHSASQRPERRKPESEPEKPGQRPDARERQEGWEGEPAREERRASRRARLQPPRLQGPRCPRTPPAPLPAGPCLGPLRLVVIPGLSTCPPPPPASPLEVQELILGPKPIFS